jgi:hypothetical protein
MTISHKDLWLRWVKTNKEYIIRNYICTVQCSIQTPPNTFKENITDKCTLKIIQSLP